MKKKEKEKTTAIIKKPTTSVSIFGAMDYGQQIKAATELATAVAKIISDKELFTMIRGKKYVWCEGWTTMGAMLGIFPQITTTEEISPGRFIAHCEIRTIAGDLITAADAEADLKEKGRDGPKWRETYAARSMAETRATSKALRLGLSWVMVLAGYQAMPAEEITEAEKKATPAEINRAHRGVLALVAKLKWTKAQLKEYVTGIYQVKEFNKLSYEQLVDIAEYLQTLLKNKR